MNKGMIQQLLFPWQGTIRRFELEKQWWHRLVVVVFFTALIATLLVTWSQMMLGMAVFHTSVDRLATARYWYVDGSGAKVDIPALPEWATPTVGIAGTAAEFTVHVAVYMPDGELKEFVGKTPEQLRAAWDAAAHMHSVKRWLLSPLVAILVTLAMSYLLQSLYRVLLYVVYGSQKSVAP